MVDIYGFVEEETDKLIEEYQHQLQTVQKEKGNIKYFLKQLRKEELEIMRQQWEQAKEKGEASGAPPKTISPNRCA
ncbi:nucleoside triphosphatase, partial [Staphylococcus cohnii]